MSVTGRIRQVLDEKLPRKTGRPALDWTPSQQRKLIRFIVDADIAWKDIETVMEEPGFAPKTGNCRKQWKEMTKMNPSQLRVKDPIKREHRKKQAIRAFEEYEQRHTRIQPDIDQLPTLHHQPAHTQIHGGGNPIASLSTSHQINDPRYSKSTPNTPAVPPLSEVASPADSFAETQTPQFASHPAIPLDISKDIAEPSATPANAQSPAQTIILDEGRKRPAPLEFDLAVPASSRKKSTIRFNPSVGSEEILARSDEASNSNAKISVAPDSRTDAHHVTDPKSTVKDRLTAVAELEDKMSVPHGFIDFFKYRLTITRASVASALSSSGSVRSRWSRKESRQIHPDHPQIFREPGRSFLSQQPSSQDQTEHQWSQIAPPTITGGRANTDLFWELHLAGSPDEEIASRLEALINDGANPNAQNPDGETPLHVALRLGNLPACQVLLDKGADKNVKTLDGKGLSEYGKIAQNQAGDNVSRYLAIKTCRYAIREYDPRQKDTEVSKLATKIITPSASHKYDCGPGEDSNVGPWMKTPCESILGQLEGRQPPSAYESGYLSYGEDPVGAIPISDSPFRNINYDRLNTLAQATTISNLDDHHSPTSGFNLDLQSTYDMPPVSYLDQTPARPSGRNAPAVQKLVEYFDGRRLTKSSSVSVSMQRTSLDGRNIQEPSLAQSYSGTQTSNEATFHTQSTRPSGFEKTSRHRRAQWNVPTDPQQASHSLRHDFGLPLESVQDSASPTRLSGYLTKLPTGQMALVCPLSENTTWQYAEQEFNSHNYSPAVVRIISPPGIVPTIVPHAYAPEIGGSSILGAPQGHALQRATITSTPAWPVGEHPVQPQPAPLRLDFEKNKANNVMSTSIAGSQNALNNSYVDDWDYSRPGFNS